MSRSIGQSLRVAAVFVPLMFAQMQFVAWNQQETLKEAAKLEAQVEAQQRVTQAQDRVESLRAEELLQLVQPPEQVQQSGAQELNQLVDAQEQVQRLEAEEHAPVVEPVPEPEDPADALE